MPAASSPVLRPRVDVRAGGAGGSSGVGGSRPGRGSAPVGQLQPPAGVASPPRGAARPGQDHSDRRSRAGRASGGRVVARSAGGPDPGPGGRVRDAAPGPADGRRQPRAQERRRSRVRRWRPAGWVPAPAPAPARGGRRGRVPGQATASGGPLPMWRRGGPAPGSGVGSAGPRVRVVATSRVRERGGPVRGREPGSPARDGG